MKHCKICGECIIGNYCIDLWGRKYCASHCETSTKICKNCGAPLLTNITSSSNNREYFCKRCLDKAPETSKEIKDIYDSALDVLEIEGFSVPSSEIELKRTHSGEKGIAKIRYDALGNKEYTISILVGGYGKESVYSTICHELGHIFLYEHSDLQGTGNQRSSIHSTFLSSSLSEGFANYVSVVALESERGQMFLREPFLKERISQIKKRDYVKRIIKFVDDFGKEELKKSVKEEAKNKKLLVLPSESTEGSQSSKVKVNFKGGKNGY